MIHLRILVPGDLSAAVELLLIREPGAVHVSVVAGASREPSGDMIEADVVRAALGPIISRLEDSASRSEARSRSSSSVTRVRSRQRRRRRSRVPLARS